MAPVDLDGDGAVDLVDARPNTIALLRSLPIVRAAALDFGSRELGAGGILSLVVRNDGAAPLTMHGVGLTGVAGSDFAIVDDACSARVVPAAGACSVGLRFTPSAVGSRAAEIILTDDAGDSPQTVALAGEGLAPLPAVRTACVAGPGAPRPLVRCGVSLDTLPKGLRVALRLVRRGRVHAAADARGPGLLSLRRLRPIASGRYTLVTVVAIGARSRQTRRTVVIPRPS